MWNDAKSKEVFKIVYALQIQNKKVEKKSFLCNSNYSQTSYIIYHKIISTWSSPTSYFRLIFQGAHLEIWACLTMGPTYQTGKQDCFVTDVAVWHLPARIRNTPSVQPSNPTRVSLKKILPFNNSNINLFPTLFLVYRFH